jgi:hypothetical protein
MAECGTHARYAGGCRCDACKSANARYQKAYRERTLYGQVTVGAATDTRRQSIDDWDCLTLQQIADVRGA